MTLYDTIKEDLLSKIKDGTYREGETIPSEMELAKEYGVSRPTIRQAVQILASDGYLEKRRRRGTVVTRPKVSQSFTMSISSFEDAMRLALLSAQKMSVQIENDAKEASQKLTQETERRCQELRRQAETEARRIINDAQNATALEQARVDKAKAASGSYIAKVRRLCEEQLRYLDEIAQASSDQLRAAAPAPQEESVEVETTVKSIEDSVAKLVDGPAARPAEAAARPAGGESENTQLFQAVRTQPPAPREEGVLRDQMGFESL